MIEFPRAIVCSFAIVFALCVPRLLPAQDQVEAPSSVPQGTISTGQFTESLIFPGTHREYRVYVPAQYRDDQPAKLMVFMDGGGYANPNGSFRAPAVLDSLIHKQELPVTIAVFVNPGTIKATKQHAKDRSNRSFEYDSLGKRYAKFLIEEFLPVALEGLHVSPNPRDRAVCGISSSGICAFTVAWERPDQFGRVMSHIGSFTNIRGGWAYPGLVRKTKENPKPIRVYLQDGRDDLSNLHGNWPLGNQDLAAALQFAGYEYKLVMTEGGHSGKWAGKVFPDALRWLWSDSAPSTVMPNAETRPEWKRPADLTVNQDVPHGEVIVMPPWESAVFSGTTRDWAIYVPQQYDAAKPAALMVFQDGERLRQIDGKWSLPTVMDNLIARGDMPPTIGVFLNPGHDKSLPRRGNRSSNRSLEYDSLGDRYARFLAEEILPEVRKQYSISDDPELHAIGGSSSGAICAFTVAWERPDLFRKVYSNVGSFVHLRGGNVYPAWIRKTEPKPLRVYMADTSGDLDNRFGSWPWANQRMASALSYMGYDVRFDWAEGYSHGPDFASTQLSDALRWLWRKEEHQPEWDTSDDLGGDLTLLHLLVPGETWQEVPGDFGFADGLCADADGNLYFCDMRAPAVYRLDVASGQRTTIAEESVSGLEFGPDGRLYGCQGSQQRVVALDVQTGEVTTVAKGVQPNDLAITDDGYILITETGENRVTKIQIDNGQATTAHEGVARPNGITLSNDGGTLAVSEYGGDIAWLFRVQPQGSLDAAMPNMPLRRPIDSEGLFAFHQPPPYEATAKGDGMAVDRKGRYYVTTSLGVQVFDPTGRPCGVLPKPLPDAPLNSCILAGPDHSQLYIAQGARIFRRQLSVE